MKLKGMVDALEQWRRRGNKKDLDPEDLVGLLVDAEWISRENRRLTRRLQEARFPVAATIEDIDYQHPRGLQKAKILDLASSRWVAAHQNIIFTGPTGIGKTYLPCALGNKACRDGYRVLYYRASLKNNPAAVLTPVRAWPGWCGRNLATICLRSLH